MILSSYQEFLMMANLRSLPLRKNIISKKLKKEIIEAITTNETFFFRDNAPFELLRNKIIPDLIDRRTGVSSAGRVPVRIWSAACSTGQEVYSIAMTLMEMLPDLGKYDIFILGTDISDKVVADASYGKYNKFEIERGLPTHFRQKYFVQTGGDWRIKDEIRVMTNFRKMNLMKPFQDLGGKFDVVFCRNVAIYFNHGDKIKIFKKIAKVLQSDGALIVGGSENLGNIAPDFKAQRYLRAVFYQLNGNSGDISPRTTKPYPPGKQEKHVYIPKKVSPKKKHLKSEVKPQGDSSSALNKAKSKTDPPPSNEFIEKHNEISPKTQPTTLKEKLFQKEATKKSLLSSIGLEKKPKKSLLSKSKNSINNEKGSLLEKLRKK